MQMKSFLTVWQRVDPVLIQPHGDGVHLSLSCRLLQLSPLLSQSALHHGRLRQRAIWILHGGKHKCVSVHTYYYAFHSLNKDNHLFFQK